ncbi:hypothetical protein BpHYR1_022256 [Brachionus plicatilis]|uniref:Uncharacterized protein n=1 Tax=Brachionus plicatilis TaxID=10195 RepID=A0A3M7RT39_BRAPC|nr:hypothetical protein BpHYR1_022256 [Brachionus plicatilis]
MNFNPFCNKKQVQAENFEFLRHSSFDMKQLYRGINGIELSAKSSIKIPKKVFFYKIKVLKELEFRNINKNFQNVDKQMFVTSEKN